MHDIAFKKVAVANKLVYFPNILTKCTVTLCQKCSHNFYVNNMCELVQVVDHSDHSHQVDHHSLCGYIEKAHLNPALWTLKQRFGLCFYHCYRL